MADEKISAMDAASTPLAGTELVPLVQGGANVRTTVADITAGRTIAASGVFVGEGTVSAQFFNFLPVGFPELPAPDVAPGYRAVLLDSDVTAFGAVVSGGGSNIVPVWSDGTNWKVG
jgi:hypothetical protein